MAAPSFVNQWTGAAKADRVTVSVSPSAGNALVVCVASLGSSTTTIYLKDSGGVNLRIYEAGYPSVTNTWGRYVAYAGVTGSGYVTTFVCNDIPSGVAQILLFGGTGVTVVAGNVSEWSNVYSYFHGTAAWDNPTYTTGTGTVLSSPSITTEEANTVIIASFASNGRPVISSGPTNSFTALTVAQTTTQGASSNETLVPTYRIASSTGTYSTEVTMSASTTWGGGIVALRGNDLTPQYWHLHEATSSNTGTLPGASAQSSLSVRTVTGAATNRVMNTTAGSSQTTVGYTTGTSTPDLWYRRFMSPPLAAQTIPNQKWLFHWGTYVTVATSGISVPYGHMYIWRPSNGTKVHSFMDDTPAYLAGQTTITARGWDTQDNALTGVSISEGDILVFEMLHQISIGGTHTFYVGYDGANVTGDTSIAGFVLPQFALTLASGSTFSPLDPFGMVGIFGI